MAEVIEQGGDGESIQPYAEIDALVRRMANQGTRFDEESILALSEVTGTPPELIRASVAEQQSTNQKGFGGVLRKGLTTIDPNLRRLVGSLWIALVIGLSHAIASTIGDRSSFFGLVMVLGFMGSVYNALSAPDAKKAAVNAGLTVIGYFFFYTLVLAVLQFVFREVRGPSPMAMAATALIVSAVTFAIHGPVRQVLMKLGVRRKREERLELLQQLVTIQDRLRSTKERMAVLSVDVVGSTKIKAGIDALAVEFTFNEYHRYIGSVAQKRGGVIHSTAGDGVTCMFSDPNEAFHAARMMQSGLFEFNTLRNRIGRPLEVRIGLDFGEVMSQGDHSAQVEFSEVIDTAAHLQKACETGCVIVSGRMAEALGQDIVLLTPAAECPGAYTWRPRSRIEQLVQPKGTLEARPTQPPVSP